MKVSGFLRVHIFLVILKGYLNFYRFTACLYPIVYTNVKNFQDYNLLRYKPTISFRTNQAWGYVRKIITNLVINIV